MDKLSYYRVWVDSSTHTLFQSLALRRFHLGLAGSVYLRVDARASLPGHLGVEAPLLRRGGTACNGVGRSLVLSVGGHFCSFKRSYTASGLFFISFLNTLRNILGTRKSRS